MYIKRNCGCKSLSDITQIEQARTAARSAESRLYETFSPSVVLASNSQCYIKVIIVKIPYEYKKNLELTRNLGEKCNYHRFRAV